MATPQQQAEQARENAQQASESLRQQNLSQANAQGRRTSDELNQLKEEFQNRSSEQFNQQIQELRNRTQELEQKEQELSERLQDKQDPPSTPGLEDRPDKTALQRELRENADEFRELKEQVKNVIEKAEEIQPILAEELYDTFRNAEKNRPADALDSAARSLRVGFDEDARKEEAQARKGLQEFKEGIEKAAENVLGNDTQALESIRNRLLPIKNQLENEINRNDPQQNQQGQNPQGQNQQGQNQQGQNQQGQNQQGQNQQGQNQQGQNQQGQNQQGQNQQGQNQQGGLRLRGPDQQNENRRQPSPLGNAINRTGDPNQFDRDSAPLTGDDYLDWVDQLRDIEAMAPDAKLRANIATIREQAREIRKQFKRHSKDPNWPLVREKLLRPLNELQQEVTAELIRRSNKNATLPVDKKVVPNRYKSMVEKYFESLGAK